MTKRGFVWTEKDDQRAIAEMRKKDPNFVPDEKSWISPQSLCPHCGEHRFVHFESDTANPYDGKYKPCPQEKEYYLRRYFTTEMESCIYSRPEQTDLEKLFTVYDLGLLKKAKIKNALVVSDYNLFLSNLQAFVEFIVFKNKIRKFNIGFVDVLMLRSKKFDEQGRSDFGMFDDKHLIVFDTSKKGHPNIADENHVAELILHRKSKGMPIWFWSPTRYITNPLGDKNIREITGDGFVTVTIGDVPQAVASIAETFDQEAPVEKKARSAKQVGGKQLKGGARA